MITNDLFFISIGFLICCLIWIWILRKNLTKCQQLVKHYHHLNSKTEKLLNELNRELNKVKGGELQRSGIAKLDEKDIK